LIRHRPSSFQVRNLYPLPHHERHIYCLAQISAKGVVSFTLRI
jgi:hypothetical protein